jgi:hypothetical protein
MKIASPFDSKQSESSIDFLVIPLWDEVHSHIMAIYEVLRNALIALCCRETLHLSPAIPGFIDRQNVANAM